MASGKRVDPDLKSNYFFTRLKTWPWVFVEGLSVINFIQHAIMACSFINLSFQE